jgi:hypothetical protein
MAVQRITPVSFATHPNRSPRNPACATNATLPPRHGEFPQHVRSPLLWQPSAFDAQPSTRFPLLKDRRQPNACTREFSLLFICSFLLAPLWIF